MNRVLHSYIYANGIVCICAIISFIILLAYKYINVIDFAALFLCQAVLFTIPLCEMSPKCAILLLACVGLFYYMNLIETGLRITYDYENMEIPTSIRYLTIVYGANSLIVKCLQWYELYRLWIVRSKTKNYIIMTCIICLFALALILTMMIFLPNDIVGVSINAMIYMIPPVHYIALCAMMIVSYCRGGIRQ